MITEKILFPLIGRQIILCRSDFSSEIIGTIDSLLIETVHLDLGRGRIEVIPFSRIAMVEFYGDDGFRKTAYPVPEKTATPKEAAFPAATNSGYIPGMSLRDWFAGQALAGILANQTALVEILNTGDQAQSVATKIAVNTYSIANAMLKAREVNP